MTETERRAEADKVLEALRERIWPHIYEKIEAAIEAGQDLEITEERPVWIERSGVQSTARGWRHRQVSDGLMITLNIAPSEPPEGWELDA